MGPLRRQVADETGLSGVEVVLPGTHDTASAVMAVPAAGPAGERPDWCYISSGTWSLMGVESPRPVVNEKCRQLNFTNEGGVGGTTRLLKNISRPVAGAGMPPRLEPGGQVVLVGTT